VCIPEAGVRAAVILDGTFTVDINAVAGAIPRSRAPPAVGVVLVDNLSAESPTGVLGITRSLHVDTAQVGRRSRSRWRCSKTRAQCDGQRGDRDDLFHVFPPCREHD